MATSINGMSPVAHTTRQNISTRRIEKVMVAMIVPRCHEREEDDFRPRNKIPHKGKWTEPRTLETQGCIANCVMKDKAGK